MPQEVRRSNAASPTHQPPTYQPPTHPLDPPRASDQHCPAFSGEWILDLVLEEILHQIVAQDVDDDVWEVDWTAENEPLRTGSDKDAPKAFSPSTLVASTPTDEPRPLKDEHGRRLVVGPRRHGQPMLIPDTGAGMPADDDSGVPGAR